MNITQKGQVTIPQEIREKYRLFPHSTVEFIEEGNRVYIRPSRDQTSARRFTAVCGSADTGMSTEEILALTRPDAATENAPEYQK